VVKAYAAEVGGLTPAQRALVAELADELASSVALARTLTAYAREVDDRVDAMNTRRTIDLALGVIMERAQCGPDEAYELLRRQSQHSNVRVFDAARDVVAALEPSSELVAPFERR
jgi:AmiR/NasT family two-component response regulator